MLIPNQDVQDALSHWIGDKRLSDSAIHSIKKSLHSNESFSGFQSSFGDPTIHGFVGFVDLAGFSTATHNKTASEVADYVSPFFRKIIPVITDQSAMIDKLIGDEIMFVLPEYPGFDRSRATLSLGWILGGLHDAAMELTPKYKFRIGISYGPLCLSRISAGGYDDWSVYGEPINVAKRLHDLPQLNDPEPVAGAFGLKAADSEFSESDFQGFAQTIAGFSSRWKLNTPEASTDFKGVGSVRWSSFSSAIAAQKQP